MSKIFRTNVTIVSSSAGTSGLNLANLPSGTPQTSFNGVLGIDAAGNVVKINATSIGSVTYGPTAPSSPVVGQQWFDTSVNPAELKIFDGTTWVTANEEVQHYANVASFPTTGNENILYVDDSSDIIYVWDSTTSTYKNASGTGSGIFSITDGTVTQGISVGETISFVEAANVASVLNLQVTSPDTVQLSAVAGHTNGQAIVSNGTNLVFANVGRKFATTITPVANTPQTITHNFNSEDVIVQAYDATTKEQVSVDVAVTGLNTVSITSTTTDTLRVVILG